MNLKKVFSISFLLKKAKEILKQLHLSGSHRTLTVKKNAYFSFVLMILSNIVQLSFVPVVIDCINPLRYGIWLTITSFLSWFNLMDLGIGGGLRTRLNQALAENDLKRAKVLVSTAYFSLFAIVAFVFSIYYIVRPWIKWEKVFNAPAEMGQELDKLMLYVILFFLIRFLLQLINPINVAHSRTAAATLNNFAGSLLSLSIIYFFSGKLQQSLFGVGFIYSASPLFVYLIVSLIFFYYHRQIIPSVFHFSKEALKSMSNLGFLILADKLSVIVIISSTNMLISHLTSPAQVTPYSITNRLFILFITIYEIAATPLLPAFADAYFKGDIKWIKKTMKKLNYVTIAFISMVTLTIFIIKPFVKIWLKGRVNVSWSIIILVATYTSVRLMWNIYSKYLNGVGMIKESVALTVISTALYVPLVLLLGKYLNMGITGLLLVQIILSLGNVFYLPWLYRKSIAKREAELAGI
jgi:O-antigen/teichoic acid export membrane protein